MKKGNIAIDNAIALAGAVSTAKSEVIKVETYYEDDCLTDYKKKPLKMWVFIRVFELRRTSKRAWVKVTHDLIEFTSNTQKELDEKVYRFIDGTDDEVPKDVNKNWIPDHLKEMAGALSKK